MIWETVSLQMRKYILFLSLLSISGILSAGIVEKTFRFANYTIRTTGDYKTVNFDNTQLSGIPGEPVLPYREIVLMLPPGEAAASVELTG